ncbi:DapH/DapD/GlmU-related protein [Pseudomonas sp. SLFW]|uniref:DapH/DapD/GlmU-related protein n=1 Tax=Pseudomonas sp. SLFW TaxID=2683259 RepID=UPI002114E2C8|nr:DapH/DapD/GlmU-related protein [Pseudomonas sp. SLFW]
MMLWLYNLKKHLKPAEYTRLLSTHDLGKKKSNRLLSKTGVVTAGNAVIRPPFYFERGRITLGRNVLINAGCVFLDQAGITIGADAMLGPQVRLCTTTHDLNPALRHSHTRSSPISIGANAWIGAGVVILPGISIGENSVIGANSVVNTDVPANALYTGSPARFKKWLTLDSSRENGDPFTELNRVLNGDATPG